MAILSVVKRFELVRVTGLSEGGGSVLVERLTDNGVRVRLLSTAVTEPTGQRPSPCVTDDRSNRIHRTARARVVRSDGSATDYTYCCGRVCVVGNSWRAVVVVGGTRESCRSRCVRFAPRKNTYITSPPLDVIVVIIVITLCTRSFR